MHKIVHDLTDFPGAPLKRKSFHYITQRAKVLELDNLVINYAQKKAMLTRMVAEKDTATTAFSSFRSHIGHCGLEWAAPRAAAARNGLC